jgi:hypothetical protein
LSAVSVELEVAPRVALRWACIATSTFSLLSAIVFGRVSAGSGLPDVGPVGSPKRTLLSCRHPVKCFHCTIRPLRAFVAIELRLAVA